MSGLRDLLEQARELAEQLLPPAEELAGWTQDHRAARLALELAQRPLDLQAELQGYPIAGEDALALVAEARAEWGADPAQAWTLLASGQVLGTYRWTGAGEEELLAFLRAPVLRHPSVAGWSCSPDRWRQLDAGEVALLLRDHQERGGDQARAHALGRLGTPVAPADPDLAGLWGRLAEQRDEPVPAPAPPPAPAEGPRDRFVLEEQHTHRSGACPFCPRRGRHVHQRVRCTRCGIGGDAEVMTEDRHTCPNYAAPRGALFGGAP